jgi:uncharacterized membrane-anchored protein YjiN (DUF445 family)
MRMTKEYTEQQRKVLDEHFSKLIEESTLKSQIREIVKEEIEKALEKKEIFIRRNKATNGSDVLERISSFVNDLIEEIGDSDNENT